MENNVVEIKVKKKHSIKEWWNNLKIVQFCKEHPDGVLGIIGGLITLLAGVVKIVAAKSEYDESLYIVDNDGCVNKIPSRKLRTLKRVDEPKNNEAND